MAKSVDHDQMLHSAASDLGLHCLPLSVYPNTWVNRLLTFTALWANSADDKLRMLFLFSPENRIWHSMQIVTIGDSLHESSNPVPLEKYEKIFQNVVCWKFYPELLSNKILVCARLHWSLIRLIPNTAWTIAPDKALWKIFCGYPLLSGAMLNHDISWQKAQVETQICIREKYMIMKKSSTKYWFNP